MLHFVLKMGRNENCETINGAEGQVPVSWRIEAVNVDFKDNIGIEKYSSVHFRNCHINVGTGKVTCFVAICELCFYGVDARQPHRWRCKMEEV